MREGGPLTSRQHTLAGTFRRHGSFPSRFLKQDRTLLVYLPPGYEAGDSRYPVLYLHDGQNLFDGATSFVPGQEWRVDETAERLIRSGVIEPLLIVGVYNAGADRLSEYTPTRDRRGRGGDGGAYGRMLVEELKPFIDRTYRTRSEAAHTGLGGSSLGGLVSLFLGLRYPHVFGKLALLSPSVWWDERAIVRQVETLSRKPALRIWLDTGTEEGYTSVPDTRRLRDALTHRGWEPGKDLGYLEAEGAAHNEAAWAARVEPALAFLFPPGR